MPKEQTVILVLQKEWVNTVAFLLNEGKASESTGKTHLLIFVICRLPSPLAHGKYAWPAACSDLCNWTK